MRSISLLNIHIDTLVLLPPPSHLRRYSTLAMEFHNNQNKITLESILNVKNQYYDDFTIYLHHTYCIENLYFWQDVEDYRFKPTYKKYRTMIENYIVPSAPHEINIPCHMRQDILDQHTPHCFNEAAESVLELIRVNSFLPWYQDHYLLDNAPPRHRNSLSPSLSLPNEFMKEQRLRASFSSLRGPSTNSTHSLVHFGPQHHRTKLANLFQSKREAFMIRMKKSFVVTIDNNKNWTNNTNKGFSWLAKK